MGFCLIFYQAQVILTQTDAKGEYLRQALTST